MVFGGAKQRTLRRVANASAELSWGAPVFPQSLVQRELIAGSPCEDRQRK
jgi:hypothetical protein